MARNRKELLLTNPCQIAFYEHLKKSWGELVAYRYAKSCLFPAKGGASHQFK